MKKLKIFVIIFFICIIFLPILDYIFKTSEKTENASKEIYNLRDDVGRELNVSVKDYKVKISSSFFSKAQVNHFSKTIQIKNESYDEMRKLLIHEITHIKFKKYWWVTSPLTIIAIIFILDKRKKTSRFSIFVILFGSILIIDNIEEFLPNIYAQEYFSFFLNLMFILIMLIFMMIVYKGEKMKIEWEKKVK